MKLPKNIIQAVNELEIRTRSHVASLLAGNRHSPFRGSGMSFRDFRPYEFGDDTRHISWNVTARTGHPTLKLYEEERELSILLLVDTSGSSLFGYQSKQRIQMYAELVALLGFSAVKSQDNVGIVLFNETVVSYLPPRKSKNHVLLGLDLLLRQPLSLKKSNLQEPLKYVRSICKNRSLIIVLSDFLLPPFAKELAEVSARNEVVLLRCYEDAEKLQNISGIHEAQDPETGEFYLLDGNSIQLKKDVRHFYSELNSSLLELSKRTGIDYLPLSLNDDYVKRLIQFFHYRGATRM